MANENDTYHVVIRLPFKRPEGFVEPPSILWTDEMEHQLWHYMSQKNRDWNSIAEQLGVPTPYVVRHAAFIYETQLRGIHQQLRINTNNISLVNRNTKGQPPSTKPRSTSFRSSLKSSQLQQSQQPQPSLQQPVDSDSNLLQRSTLASSSRLQTTDKTSGRSSISNNSSVYKSTTMVTSGPANSNSSNKTVKASDYAQVHTPAPANVEQQNQQTVRQNSRNDSSFRQEQQQLDLHIDPISNQRSSTQDIGDTTTAKSQLNGSDFSGNSTNSNESLAERQQSRSMLEDEEEEFSSHFERMKLQVEEPAFLPQQPLSTSSSSYSLRNSRQQLSMSLHNLRRNNNQSHLPLATPLSSSSQSANNRSTSSSSQFSFKTTNNNPSSSITSTAATTDMPTLGTTEPTTHKTSKASINVNSATASPYVPQHFSPTSGRSPSSSPHSPRSTHNATTTVPTGSTSNESALNSIGSSFSDLSDSSITQSALEEAFLSKFNQGASKMSLLNFSHRYKD